MVAVSLLQVSKWRWGKLSQISQWKLSAPKYCECSDKNCESLYVVFHCQNDLKTQKTYRNKLMLSSGTLMFRLKENLSVFRYFFDQWNFFIEDCTLLHSSALEKTNIFVQLSLDITSNAIKCGVTTCPGYGESCHRWSSLIKWSLTTIVLRLKEIWYCSIVDRGSLENLAYHSFPECWMQKIYRLNIEFFMLVNQTLLYSVSNNTNNIRFKLCKINGHFFRS